MHQHTPRLALVNAARAQIEQRVRVEVADRRAVGAFHVVGEDDEFRLEVGFRPPAHQKRFGGLAAVGAVGALAHRDLALVDGALRESVWRDVESALPRAMEAAR